MATLIIEKIKNKRTNSNFVGLFPIPGTNGSYYYKLSPAMTIEKIPMRDIESLPLTSMLRIQFYDGKVEHQMDFIPERDEAFLKILTSAPDVLASNQPEESKPTAQFRAYIKEERNKQKSTEIINKSKVIAKAVTMTDEQLRNVCYYFRLPAQSWERDEMLLNLVGDSGQLFVRPVVNGKIEDRMEMFLSDQFSTDIEFELRTSVNKAIEMGHISFRGDMFYYGEKAIGATVDHVILYFTNNMDAYENGLKKTIGSTFEADSSVFDEKPLTDAERISLQEEARRLGIKGDIKKFKDDTLVQKVTEARASANN